jgi:hypothetical protein
MARSIYFSFHYQDVVDFRANVVRNSGKFRQNGEIFRDGSIWEEAAEKQVYKIKQLIDSELIGSSVTCVLIGSETYTRRWVRYEIMKSLEMKKGLVGVGINWIKDKKGNTKFWPGENPFDYLGFEISKDGKTLSLFEKNNSWIPFKDLPQIKNSVFGEKYYGKDFKLSDFFKTYSYTYNDGNSNFPSWIEDAALNVGR